MAFNVNKCKLLRITYRKSSVIKYVYNMYQANALSDNLVKGVQCYELFGGIALKNDAFSFFIVRGHAYSRILLSKFF